MTPAISRSCIVSALLGSGALSLGVPSAHATVVSGSSLAFGEGVSATIATSGPLPLASGTAPAPYNTMSTLRSASGPNLLITGLLTANIYSDVDGGSGVRTTAASATTNNLSLVLDSLTVGLTTISSQASVFGDYGGLAVIGGTAVSGLTINGVPIVTATLPANDVLLSAPDLTITLNQQVAGGDGVGSRSLQVRGLDIASNGFPDGPNLLSGEIVIAESTAREGAAQAPTPVPEPASLAIPSASRSAPLPSPAGAASEEGRADRSGCFFSTRRPAAG